MKRIYEPSAYGPQGACYWADTVKDTHWPELHKDLDVDVAIVGGGFTGLNAALALAQAGQSVVVLDANHDGWGASGRNGGFCCLGGGKASEKALRKSFGNTAPRDWAQTERAAVDYVDQLITQAGWDVDRHSDGETLVAHKPSRWSEMQAQAANMRDLYGVAPRLVPKSDMGAHGFGGPWYGALTMPVGFALNPRKYHAQLAGAAQKAGARLFANSAVTQLDSGSKWTVHTERGKVTADQVVIATNGYSSDDLPSWMRARYLPVLSNVIVTQPLTADQIAAQGWTSHQMTYDSRHLLHYFRLMPNGRFLFGMRGGLRATKASDRALSQKIRHDFAHLFPAWQGCEITHEWSGLVCLMPNLMPFVGPVPGQNGLFAAMGFHGNGVAMASYSGALIASIMSRQPSPGPYPDFLMHQPRRFPLGRWRRALLRPAYLAASLLDR